MNEGKVLGIGGVFMRASDPVAMAAWYRRHLGIVVTTAGEPDPEGNWVWPQEAGDTVFSMFAGDTDYFPADRTAMINFRVAGLDAILARMEAAGVAIGKREEMEGVGRFAHVDDPEGNRVELWEPA